MYVAEITLWRIRSWTGSQWSCLRMGVMWSVFLHFETVLAAAFCAACWRSICVWGKPARRLLQQSSFDRISETVILFAALRVRYERTLLKDLTWKKQDPKTAKTCWSKERATSKVTPRVFTTLENGMDASPAKRLSTGTLSLLEGGLQKKYPSFLLIKLQFVFHHPSLNLMTTRLNIPFRSQGSLTFCR